MIEKIIQIHENSMAEQPVRKFIYIINIYFCICAPLFIANKAYKKWSFFISYNAEQVYHPSIQKY